MTFLTLLPLQVCIAALSFTYLSVLILPQSENFAKGYTSLLLPWTYQKDSIEACGSKTLARCANIDVQADPMLDQGFWASVLGDADWKICRPHFLHHATHSPQPEAVTVAILRDLSSARGYCSRHTWSGSCQRNLYLGAPHRCKGGPLDAAMTSDGGPLRGTSVTLGLAPITWVEQWQIHSELWEVMLLTYYEPNGPYSSQSSANYPTPVERGTSEAHWYSGRFNGGHSTMVQLLG